MSKDPAAVKLGRKGGQSTSPAKKAACRANVAKARKAKQEKRHEEHERQNSQGL
jgi:hypothetical protein